MAERTEAAKPAGVVVLEGWGTKKVVLVVVDTGVVVVTSTEEALEKIEVDALTVVLGNGFDEAVA